MSRCDLLRIFAEYPLGVHPQEENFARTQDFIQRLAPIHPYLDTFSPSGTSNSWSKLLTETPVAEMDYARWQYYYTKETKSLDREYGKDSRLGLGVRLSYWNRRRPKEGRQSIWITYNACDTDRRNEIWMTNIPVELYEPAILDAVMQAFIDSFDMSRAEYAWLDSNSDPAFLYHHLWVKGDAPFPTGDYAKRYKSNHPPPPISVPWHGGTRYTWPEHYPLTLVKKYE